MTSQYGILKGKASHAICGNPPCKTPAKHKICSCQSVRYCSEACQRAHWSDHQVLCVHNRRHIHDVIVATEGAHNALKHVSDAEVEVMLREWVRFHAFALMGATVYALGLHRDIRRSRSHILQMRISVSGAASIFRPESAFKVELLYVAEQSAVTAIGNAWTEGLHKLAQMQRESEQASKGAVAALFIECNIFGLYVLPFGALRDLGHLRDIGDSWLNIALRAIHQGKRIRSFEDWQCTPGFVA